MIAIFDTVLLIFIQISFQPVENHLNFSNILQKKFGLKLKILIVVNYALIRNLLDIFKQFTSTVNHLLIFAKICLFQLTTT